MYKLTELRGDRWNSEISIKHDFSKTVGTTALNYRYDSSTWEQLRPSIIAGLLVD